MIYDGDGNQRYYGIYRGEVVANNDPLKKRRVKVQIPHVIGNQTSDWIYNLDAANTKFDVPSIHQGVAVMFENGDPSHPIWVGTFGKSKGGHHVLIKAATGAITGLITHTHSDGTVEIDLMATLKSFQDRIALLESQMPTALAS
jgi:hypothetical protein